MMAWLENQAPCANSATTNRSERDALSANVFVTSNGPTRILAWRESAQSNGTATIATVTSNTCVATQKSIAKNLALGLTHGRLKTANTSIKCRENLTQETPKSTKCSLSVGAKKTASFGAKSTMLPRAAAALALKTAKAAILLPSGKKSSPSLSIAAFGAVLQTTFKKTTSFLSHGAGAITSGIYSLCASPAIGQSLLA